VEVSFADAGRVETVGRKNMSARVRIVGAGLAGSEAAWQCARRGVDVELFEMRPVRTTPAHQTPDFAELVCSNSLKSDSENTAPWLLKEEMRRAGSLLLRIARECAVPAGHALAVDRVTFAQKVTETILREPRIRVQREEVTRIEESSECVTVIASGPLTSEALTGEIARLSVASATKAVSSSNADTATLKRCSTQNLHLYFYDSISPIVEADSIDLSRVYMAARYDKGSADYINCPMTREEYDAFYDALVAAQAVEERDWEKLNYFESCLPIEEIARRGRDTLRFGPMKPVGLKDPRTGKMPYAVVQLRQENLRADSYNLVGFQNHLKFGEQARVLRLIPGLENARFLRYGQIHRNTYINGPALLRETLQMKAHPRVLFAGQICGVEGYVESIATGLLAGVHAADLVQGNELVEAPRASAFGSLTHYVTHADAKNFQPANITFDLLPALEKKIRDRKERHRLQCEVALREFDAWLVLAGVESDKGTKAESIAYRRGPRAEVDCPRDCQIRRATPEDAHAIAYVLQQSFLEFRPLYTDDGFEATALSAERMTKRIEEGPVWVALRRGAIFGTVAAVMKGESVYVRGMAVLPEARGSGAGAKLLQEVEGWARNEGYARLFLSTTPFLDSAIRLYEQFGFQRVNEDAQHLFGTPLFTMEKSIGD
jgi:methylenetetrahydrofolate--tRNA-(uracil-5-)-methyltransferase